MFEVLINRKFIVIPSIIFATLLCLFIASCDQEEDIDYILEIEFQDKEGNIITDPITVEWVAERIQYYQGLSGLSGLGHKEASGTEIITNGRLIVRLTSPPEDFEIKVIVETEGYEWDYRKFELSEIESAKSEVMFLFKETTPGKMKAKDFEILSNKIVDHFEFLCSSNSISEARKQLVPFIKKQRYVDDAGLCQDDISIWIEMSDGSEYDIVTQIKLDQDAELPDMAPQWLFSTNRSLNSAMSSKKALILSPFHWQLRIDESEAIKRLV